MPLNDIAVIAKSCSNTIETALKYAANLPNLHDWLEVQAARLNLWADALGVHARYELSAAFRLSKNAVVAKQIVQLLSALSSNLRLLQNEILPEDLAASAERQLDEDSSGSGSFSASSDEQDPVGYRQGQIEDDLRRLTYIAIKVRREGMGRSLARASTFEPVGDDGNLLEPEFGRFIDSTLKRAFDVGQSYQQDTPTSSFHPDELVQAEPGLQQYRIPDYLRKRLRKTMLDRWRRISYQRHHAAGLAAVPDAAETVPDSPMMEPQISYVDIEPVSTASIESVAAPKDARQTSLIRAPKTTATETPSDFVIPKEAEILPKAPGTMATSVRAGELSYPRMPQKKEGIEVFACPFCSQLQPSSLLDRDRWRRHVRQDLSPYFCLFEDCSDPHLSYPTTETWVQHCINAHSQDVWWCVFCPRGASDSFKTPESYAQHLIAQHADKGATAHAVEALIDLGCQRLPPKLPYCVFCGFEPEAGQHDINDDAFQKAITDHIAKQHMEVFALDSMPWDIPGADEDSAYRMTHQSHTDSVDARDDVLDDEEFALNFVLDEREKERLANDPSLSHILHAEPASMASSLEMIKSITKMTFDHKNLAERLRDKIELWRRKENDDRENDSMPGHDQNSRKWAEERMKEVIEWISPSSQMSIHESCRASYKAHSNDTLLHTDIYEAWKSGDIRHIWIYGPAGSGKTVLCSSIVQDILDYCHHSVNVGQAMFYFSYCDPDRQTMEDLVRSMMVQLGSQEPGTSLLCDAYQAASSKHPSLAMLQGTLQAIVRSYDEVFLHLDGLDECELSSGELARIVGELIDWLKATPNVRLCVTSRNRAEMQTFASHLGAVPLALGTSVTMDIQKYVSTSLQFRPRFSRFDAATKSLTEHVVVEKSEGMFLWAVLQLQFLEKLTLTSPIHVRTALATLPPSICTMYRRILDNIPRELRSVAMEALQMIAYAESPLSYGSLISGLSTDVHGNQMALHNYGWRAVVRDLTRLIHVPEDEHPTAVGKDQFGPADLFPEDATIKLQHHSILTFLEAESAEWYHFNPQKAHSHIAQICLAHLVEFIEGTKNAAGKGLIYDDLISEDHFLPYAGRNWYLHYRRQEPDDESAEAISFLISETKLHGWLRVHQPDKPDAKPFAEFKPSEAGGDLYYACCCGLEGVAERLLDIGRDVNVQGGRCGSPLNAAAMNDHVKVMELLLKRGAHIDTSGGVYSSTIQAAIIHGHVAGTKLLLDYSADDPAYASSWKAAYEIAEQRGYAEITKLIVEAHVLMRP